MKYVWWVTCILYVCCAEVFYVEDPSSGAVVQGSRVPAVDVEHVLKLECCLRLPEEFASDWRVVDIDDWLQGNEFIHAEEVTAREE